jgi:hypothetical protein
METAHEMDGALSSLCRTPVSRGALLKAAAAGLTLSLLPGAVDAQGHSGTGAAFPFFPQIPSGTYTTETVQTIINDVVTAHYLAATGATMTLANAATLGLTGWELSAQQAAAAREQYQIDFLTSLGAEPLVTAFTFPPAQFSNLAVNLATAEGAATILVALHMTATRELAELGQPMLAKWMYQMGTQVAEQRAIFRTVRAINGVSAAVPPNNKAFATDLFLYTRDALGILTALGLINGPGPAVNYPGRDAVLAAAGPMADAVIQQHPNNATSSVTFTGPASITGERT